MNSRGSATSHRLSSASSFRSRISFLMLSMFATMASLYVAGRLWQDAESRVYLIKELDRRTGQGHSAISVDDTLKIIDCREQQKKLAALQVELERARHEGSVFKQNSGTHTKKKLLAVMGIMTRFGRKNNRDAIRKAWMPSGPALRKLEDEKGIIIRFVIGRSAKHGDSLDKDIDNENMQASDFMILNDYKREPIETSSTPRLTCSFHDNYWHHYDHYPFLSEIQASLSFPLSLSPLDSDSSKQLSKMAHPLLSLHLLRSWENDVVEAPEERSKKVKLFFANAVEHWDAEFYVKANDDIYVNIDALGAVLASHLDKPRIYIGCMKSGEVFSQPSHKWYEPEWWKFGAGKSYFRHASGEIYAISQTLAQFISINRSILRIYAHDDVSAGSWFIGTDVKHIDEGKFCCSSWSSGSICATS